MLEIEGKAINYLEKPFEEYIRCNAEVFVGTKAIKKSKIKCFLWLPKNIGEEPHFYLLIEDYQEYEIFKNKLNKDHRVINLRIPNCSIGDDEPYGYYLIKKAYFSRSNLTMVAKDWDEAFIKYIFPKNVLKYLTRSFEDEKKVINFYISKSELLTSFVSISTHYTGEIRRKVIHNIFIEEEVSHLGIESVITDQYIESQESNILQIEPISPVRSLLEFYKVIKPIADLVLLITSFAERRRINWYKCHGVVANNYVENYNTRTSFFQDKKGITLISKSSFEDFLKNSLQNIELKEVNYIKDLLQHYLSGMDYTVDARIILWHSILEKILKKNFQKKNDTIKADLITKMSVYTSDLSPLKDLIDVRNKIAHGDNISTDKLFHLGHEWKVLIERVLLQELRWGDISVTDVYIDNQ